MLCFPVNIKALFATLCQIFIQNKKNHGFMSNIGLKSGIVTIKNKT